MFGWFVAFLKSVCTCLGLVTFGSRNFRAWLSINFLYLYLSTLLSKKHVSKSTRTRSLSLFSDRFFPYLLGIFIFFGLILAFI